MAGITAAILGGAVIAGGASLAAGAMQASAAENAAETSADAQLQQYYQTRKDLAPWRETGGTALGEYGRLFGIGREGLLSEEDMQAARDRFQETPGYQFQFDEGLRALDRSASARGRLQGGGYGRELTRYGQGMASTEFGNYANRLASLAGIGQSATNQTAAYGAQAAQGAGNAYLQGGMAAGTARASGYAGAANAVNSGVQNYMLANYLNKPPALMGNYSAGYT